MLESYRLRMAALGGQEGDAKRRNAQKIMDAQTFDEILVESDYLIDDLPLPVGDLERWEKHGLTDFEKYCVAFLYAAMQMEHDRYRICRKCGRAYFSTNEFSEYCDECEDRYSHV